jgi:hypothetical protein
MSFYAMPSVFAFQVSSRAMTARRMKVSDPLKTQFAKNSVPTWGRTEYHSWRKL